MDGSQSLKIPSLGPDYTSSMGCDLPCCMYTKFEVSIALNLKSRTLDPDLFGVFFHPRDGTCQDLSVDLYQI